MTTLKTMYDGVAGSPETIITVQYVAGVSPTITVEDASVLPDAPNRVVLQRSSDSAFVTVFYGTRVANILGSLTPEAGFTGTFPVGSTAARRFTEGDHKELRDNITTLNSDKLDIAQGAGNASKIVVTNASGNVTTLAKKTAFNSDLATEKPLMDGNAEVGTSIKVAKEDHRHPRDSVLQSQIDFINTLNSPIIGVQWDTTSTNPVLTRIDVAGNALGSMTTADFDKHILFGGRWRCVRNRTTGKYTFGTNARGDGLTLDGTAGDVTVREPVAYVKADYDVAGTGIARYWVSPRPAAGFVVHPFWMQRNNGIASPVAYSGAYESYGYLDGSTFKIGSASGKQPITGGVAYPDLPNSGRFNISDAETYANNITGTIRSGIENIWNYSASQLLMYIEFGTFDLQTALGKGIVDLESGTDFAGKLTGADDIDSRLAENGTGTGSGVDGQTPICWRGKENPWGNCYKFNIGANVYVDGSVRLLKRDGTGTPAATLAAGSYDTVTGPIALTSGYISATLQDDVSNIAFLPASVAGGGSAYYLCDYYSVVTANGNILRAGGYWNAGLAAGPGYRSADSAPSASYRTISARLEFYPEGGEV
jgi:hypothetical protein